MTIIDVLWNLYIPYQFFSLTRRMTELLDKSDRQYTLNGLHTNASYAVQVMKYDKFAWRVG